MLSGLTLATLPLQLPFIITIHCCHMTWLSGLQMGSQVLSFTLHSTHILSFSWQQWAGAAPVLTVARGPNNANSVLPGPGTSSVPAPPRPAPPCPSLPCRATVAAAAAALSLGSGGVRWVGKERLRVVCFRGGRAGGRLRGCSLLLLITASVPDH